MRNDFKITLKSAVKGTELVQLQIEGFNALKLMLGTFPKAFFQASTTSQGYFPNWQLLKREIS